ncbi:hypothetical protein [Terrabacter sp. BE26]|uniref:hypothetical protein n=1 Tax=Terrabacter sp. BE26 TaxID=2898152 RepID=UPI0035BE9694
MGGSGNLPVGPGIWGFLAFFVLAVALWFLVRNMNSRLRRMAYRDRDEANQVHTDDADGTRVTGAEGTGDTGPSSHTGEADGPSAGQSGDQGSGPADGGGQVPRS